MTLRIARLLLTSHITFSVGWLGAVVVFLAFAITGLASADIQLARAVFIAMEICGWYVIVPFCFASLLTGIIQSLATQWGLFRHYWIIVKLILTIAATVLLLLHMEPISYIAGIAEQSSFSNTELPGLRIQLIADAGAALVLLLTTTTISVYKPWGRITYNGWQNIESYPRMMAIFSASKKSPGFYILIGLLAVILTVMIIHLFGGGMGAH
jgi:hypothetical protein